jgi:hypothetical protein
MLKTFCPTNQQIGNPKVPHLKIKSIKSNAHQEVKQEENMMCEISLWSKKEEC